MILSWTPVGFRMAHSPTIAFFVICVLLLPSAIARVSITSSSSLQTKVSRSDSTTRDTKYQRCAVEDWPFCMAACPRDTTLEEALQGEYGAHVGIFVKSPVDREENLTMSGCCTACTDFNSAHFSDIFGYVCDYWSWNKVTGLCTLYDRSIVCRSPAHLTHEVFDEKKTGVVSFPAAC